MATSRPRAPFTFPDHLTKEQWQKWADDAGKSLNTWMIMMIEKGIAAVQAESENVEVISPEFVLELPVEVYSGHVQQVAINVESLADDPPELREFVKRYEKYLLLKSDKSRTKAMSDLLDDMSSFWPAANDRPQAAIELYSKIFNSKNQGATVSFIS